MADMSDERVVWIDYVNWRGERAWRRIRPIDWYFGQTEYHPQAQYLLDAHDLDKGVVRTFAQKDIREWRCTPPAPKVVVLCGSTKFRDEYAQAFRDEEHAGNICLTVPCYKSDPCCKTPEDHARLDALHRAKIRLADEAYVVNPGGYLGESTRQEIRYLRSLGKPIRSTEPIPEDLPA